MKPENLLKTLDNQSYCNVIAAMVLLIALFILSPFVWEFTSKLLKGKRSA